MAYEQRDNSFSAFKNNRKEKDTHADLTGKGMVNGEMMWINIWKKKDKNGNTWLSIALKPMEGHGEENQTRRQEPRRSANRTSTRKPDPDYNDGPERDQDTEVPW